MAGVVVAGGVVYANGAASTNAADSLNDLGSGFMAENGGVLYADKEGSQAASASGCRIAGFASLSNSASTSNGSSGFS